MTNYILYVSINTVYDLHVEYLRGPAEIWMCLCVSSSEQLAYFSESKIQFSFAELWAFRGSLFHIPNM